jgi:hypothetical protein
MIASIGGECRSRVGGGAAKESCDLPDVSLFAGSFGNSTLVVLCTGSAHVRPALPHGSCFRQFSAQIPQGRVVLSRVSVAVRRLDGAHGYTFSGDLGDAEGHAQLLACAM